ncbi:hypothetical protein GcM3_151017 [Golovinomyces cichoracearum]|uniref:Uncharacterized protein n=1 Tax=Golovinomyces cichoracearum TaxID=62708 RepID=A0A420HX19_9PEZI|nr:hypothetical protein GcM3_151017 [Golovinomyces cichoracearum]
MFDKANKPCIRELCDLLPENGVYIHKEKLVSITNELVKVINEKEPHEWTTEQVKEQMRDKFNSRFSSLAISSGSLLDQRSQRQKSKPSQDMIQNNVKIESGYQGQNSDHEQTPEYKTYLLKLELRYDVDHAINPCTHQPRI